MVPAKGTLTLKSKLSILTLGILSSVYEVHDSWILCLFYGYYRYFLIWSDHGVESCLGIHLTTD